MLLKAILITLILLFIIIKIGGLIFRTMFWMLGARNGQRNPSRPGQPYSGYKHEGEIEIEYVPGKNGKRRKADFKGGEYVDYEEVK